MLGLRSCLVTLCLLCLPAWAGADTLGDIRKTGVMKIGFRADVPPFSSLDASGNPHGFSIDICVAIADSVAEHLSLPNFAVEYVPVTAANRLRAVASGEVHIECGNTTSTLSRQEIVDFSNLFYVTGASLMTTTAHEVNGVEDLKGFRIAVVENTTTLKVLQDQLAEANVSADLVVVASHSEAVKMLEDGNVQMVAADRATLLGLGFSSAKLKVLRLTQLMLSFEPYAFPVPRNDADFRLVVNRALSEIYVSGRIGSLWQNWFGRYEVQPTQLLLDVYRLNSPTD
jgi:ABC-type amino acid transport substrate-binding protein